MYITACNIQLPWEKICEPWHAKTGRKIFVVVIPKVGPSILLYRPRSRGDNAFGSICLPVRPSVCALMPEPFELHIYHYQSKVCVCVCSQLLFRQVAPSRSIMLLIWYDTDYGFYSVVFTDDILQLPARPSFSMTNTKILRPVFARHDSLLLHATSH